MFKCACLKSYLTFNDTVFPYKLLSFCQLLSSYSDLEKMLLKTNCINLIQPLITPGYSESFNTLIRRFTDNKMVQR